MRARTYSSMKAAFIYKHKLCSLNCECCQGKVYLGTQCHTLSYTRSFLNSSHQNSLLGN